MARNRQYEQVGYWGEKDDVDFLIDKDADYIVNYMEQKMGAFYKTYGQCVIKNPLICEDYETMEITADKQYLIRKEENHLEIGGGFIDVYELKEIED